MPMTIPPRNYDVPVHPLTPAEEQVAQMAANGYGIQEIATRTGKERSTVAGHINRIAMKLTPEDGVTPLTRVQLWAAHRVWLKQHVTDHPSAA